MMRRPRQMKTGAPLASTAMLLQGLILRSAVNWLVIPTPELTLSVLGKYSASGGANRPVNLQSLILLASFGRR
jgi:hypothetical protein